MFEDQNSVASPVRQQVMPVDEWISTPKAAELAGVHRATMHRICKRMGTGFAVQIGRNYKIRMTALTRLLESGAINEQLYT